MCHQGFVFSLLFEMNLCISNGNKCDSQMFVTRTADANLETVKQPLGHDGLKSTANVKKKRFQKKNVLYMSWP